MLPQVRRLEEQAEPVAAVRGQHHGALLLGELGTVVGPLEDRHARQGARRHVLGGGDQQRQPSLGALGLLDADAPPVPPLGLQREAAVRLVLGQAVLERRDLLDPPLGRRALPGVQAVGVPGPGGGAGHELVDDVVGQRDVEDGPPRHGLQP